jgi:prepilin-type N-terminal cleavage/methylation domain-containing protein
VSFVRAVKKRLRKQDGYSLVELLVTMSMLALVMGGLTQLFTSGIKAESEATFRFQAQSEGRGALSYLRREAHCADSASVSTSGSAPNQVQTLTLNLPSGCPTGTGTVKWCTSGSSYRFKLYRKAGATCDATGKQYADYLTSGVTFTYTAPSPTALGSIGVDFSIDPNSQAVSPNAYRLQDSLVLRNTVRA